MALMSIAEVKTAAFNRTVDDTQFKLTDIDIAEFKYIREALTENLYNAVVATPASYATLITTYLKPALAYWVKYINFENFYTEISDRGINQLTGTNYQTASNQARTDLKTEVLEKARLLTEKMVDYVSTEYYAGNTLFSLYKNESNVHDEPKLIAGFLMDEEQIDTIEKYKAFRRFL